MKNSFRFGLLLISLIAVSPAAMALPLSAAQVALPMLVAQASGLLGVGDSGNAVALLQTQLASLGFYQGAIDGEFGSQTEAAVIQFQTSQGLVPDGVVGPQTLAAIDRLTSSPSPIVTDPIPLPAPVSGVPSAPASSIQGGRFSVVELQRRLQARGFYQGAIDGILGSQTRAAIRAAQRAYGLEADDILNGRF
ncbi:peptidoglycan-binding protein [Microcoleus sp. FACHB-1515]|uniref:peptidoglycan-binding domain-containing protein n=1 Tax=Cyanophyceae TaxID=3028117 RepID=UPI001685DD75|nr:peptidoglycan-binding protein [Microcoleus sp. FACHB-1515]MBD2089687.1 peptidoglycan-binding protein [Microcoleus sp. FACHB-1515]